MDVLQVDAQLLSQAFAKQCFGSVLALNQAVVVGLGGNTILIRITATDTLDECAQQVNLPPALRHSTRCWLVSRKQRTGHLSLLVGGMCKGGN